MDTNSARVSPNQTKHWDPQDHYAVAVCREIAKLVHRYNIVSIISVVSATNVPIAERRSNIAPNLHKNFHVRLIVRFLAR